MVFFIVAACILANCLYKDIGYDDGMIIPKKISQFVPHTRVSQTRPDYILNVYQEL